MWLLLIAIAVATFVLLVRTFKHDNHRSNLPPSPKGHWLWGHLTSFLYPIETLHERLGALARDHPEAVTLRAGPAWLPYWLSPPIVVLNDPALVRQAFTGSHGSVAIGHEDEIRENVATVIGGGLLGVDGKVWRSRRSHVSSTFFTRDALRRAVPVVDHHLDRTVAALENRSDPEAPINMHEHYFIPLMLAIMTDLLCGSDASHDSASGAAIDGPTPSMPWSVARDMGVVFAEFNDRTFRLFKTFRPTSQGHREALPRVRAHISSLISRRRRVLRVAAENGEEAPLGRHDLLTVLIGDGSGDGGTNPYDSDRDIEAEALLFMFAGFESASNTLAYAAHLLARHPSVQERARAEVMSDCQGRPGYSALAGLPYLDAVLSEAMRMYPIAHTLTRRVRRDIVLGAYQVPAGSRLLLNNLGISNAKAVWGDPENFRPERWLSEPSDRPDTFASIPFGAGLRICPGQKLAMLEMKIILGRLLGQFRFEPDPANPNLKRRVAFVTRPQSYSVRCVPL
ncbi:Cytochrome P450 [Mollivirus sibericum]|uniref:Cytochrome P450 n=1 Tax=Mollivirus sibericum TaxID=1678078 RepID=UPI0006B2DE99|nr:Cytochrome P450 [Mollivirus sibericum]ALD61988.1 Cytochrome P450 [Mollivirus sibericum]